MPPAVWGGPCCCSPTEKLDVQILTTHHDLARDVRHDPQRSGRRVVLETVHAVPPDVRRILDRHVGDVPHHEQAEGFV